MVRPTSYSISLTSKCQSAAVVLVGHLAVAGRIPWNRVCLPFHPAVCFFFFKFGSLGFSELWHGTRKLYQVLHARFFGKTFFALKNWGNRPKIGEK